MSKKNGLFPNEDIENFSQFVEWLNSNKKTLLNAFSESGILRLNGFPIEGPDQFNQVMGLLFGSEDYSYYGGTSPRNELVKGVYTSTNMPFYMKIPLHSEMAYRYNFPKVIGFFCEKAPFFSGETPVADNREVYRSIPAQLREKVISHGIIYYRRLRKMTPIFNFLSRFNPMLKTASWDHVFNTSKKDVVEKYCQEQGYGFEWGKNDSLILKTTIPASIEKGEQKVWMNSLHFFQVHARIWGKIPTLFVKFFQKVTGKRDLSARLGNSEKLTSVEVNQLVDAFEKNQLNYKWEKGNIMILNNVLFSHGRNRYLGGRKVRVSLKGESNYQDFSIRNI